MCGQLLASRAGCWVSSDALFILVTDWQGHLVPDTVPPTARRLAHM